MISKHQYKKLKQISRYDGTTAQDYEEQKDMYVYLCSENLIYRAEVRGYLGYRVSQKGYSEMYAYKVEHFRFWIPTIISIIALVISCASLFPCHP